MQAAVRARGRPLCSPLLHPPHRKTLVYGGRAPARVKMCRGCGSPQGLLQLIEVIVSRISHVSFFPLIMSICVMEHMSILGNFN